MLALSLALHSRLLFTLVASFAALGIWSVVNAVRGAAVSQRYLGAIAVGELTLALEGAFGLILLAGGLQPHQLVMHLIYGVVAVLALPVAVLLNRRRSSRRQHLTLAAVCLVLCGLAFRSQATGRGPRF